MNAIFDYRELFTKDNDPNTEVLTKLSDSDYDRELYEVILIQQLDKQQYKDFNRLLRINDKTYGSCGHEWDCCGCCTGVSAEAEHLRNGIFKVKFGVYFNY